MTPRQIINTLNMQPHPEGGSYVEVYRDPESPANLPESQRDRGYCSAIYFLLQAGQSNAWHRVDAVEIWHWYAGAPLALSQKAQLADEAEVGTLGPDLLAGQRPQLIVPRYGWQSAKTLGDWTLVGCTVSPGFTFEGFEMV